jgi:proteasome lid subunit RPN8/RPN11
MTIRFPRAELARLHAHAEEGYPHEVVGILAGDRATNTVATVATLVNERADSAHNRYRVSGLVLARAETALTDAGHDILGYYHSHPDHPARWSDYDRDHAWPNMSYVIVSVQQGKVADTLSWRLVEDRSAMDPEPVTLLED